MLIIPLGIAGLLQLTSTELTLILTTELMTGGLGADDSKVYIQ